MKVSKRSWHYRFNRFNNAHFEDRFMYGRYTTCSYVRTTIASAFACLFKGAFIAFMACFALFLVMSMIVLPVMIFANINPSEPIAIFGVVGWVAAIIGLVILFVNQIVDWLRERKRRAYYGPRVEKEPSVFVQAVIDKHNKFCTLVIAED